jgi:hypothetical protein
MIRFPLAGALALWLAIAAGAGPAGHAQAGFDHGYGAYAALLRSHLRGDRVDYRALKDNRDALDVVVRSFGAASEGDVQGWSRPQQIAYWINAYNVFTLRAIVDHYPIEGSWFSRFPRNSIRQIDGVWTALRWKAAGRELTLDDIEHRILRPVHREPLVHFAVNCASVGCPPLALEPYRADGLDAQLETAARRYLASPQGLVVRGDVLSVSSILKWYGEDFVERYAGRGPKAGSAVDRAILALVAAFGPAQAKDVVARGRARIRYLAYDWSLNDVVDGR